MRDSTRALSFLSLLDWRTATSHTARNCKLKLPCFFQCSRICFSSWDRKLFVSHPPFARTQLCSPPFVYRNSRMSPAQLGSVPRCPSCRRYGFGPVLSKFRLSFAQGDGYVLPLY